MSYKYGKVTCFWSYCTCNAVFLSLSFFQTYFFLIGNIFSLDRLSPHVRNTGPKPAVCHLCSIAGFSLTYSLVFRAPVDLASF